MFFAELFGSGFQGLGKLRAFAFGVGAGSGRGVGQPGKGATGDSGNLFGAVYPHIGNLRITQGRGVELLELHVLFDDGDFPGVLGPGVVFHPFGPEFVAGFGFDLRG